MDIKVLFSRGEIEYIVEIDKLFYIINVRENTMSSGQKLEKILKSFKDFIPLKKVSENLLSDIKDVISLQRYSSTAKGVIVVGKLTEKEMLELF